MRFKELSSGYAVHNKPATRHRVVNSNSMTRVRLPYTADIDRLQICAGIQRNATTQHRAVCQGQQFNGAAPI